MFRKKSDEIPDYEINTFSSTQTFEEQKNSSTLKLIILIVIFIYVIFLVIGVLTTTYIKSSDGKNVPQVVTVELREERNYYYKLKNYYVILNDILEKSTEYDKRTKDTENTLVLVAEYQELLETLDTSWTGLKGVVVPERYNALKNLIIDGYSNTSIYLQRMSTGLVEQSKKKMNDGLKVWKITANENSNNIKQNMIYFAEVVEIIDKDLGMVNPANTEIKEIDTVTKKEETTKKEGMSESEQAEETNKDNDPFENLKGNESDGSLTADPEYRTNRD